MLYSALGACGAAMIGGLLARPLIGAFSGDPPWVLPAIVTGAIAAGLVGVLVAAPRREKRAR